MNTKPVLAKETLVAILRELVEPAESAVVGPVLLVGLTSHPCVRLHPQQTHRHTHRHRHTQPHTDTHRHTLAGHAESADSVAGVLPQFPARGTPTALVCYRRRVSRRLRCSPTRSCSSEPPIRLQSLTSQRQYPRSWRERRRWYDMGVSRVLVVAGRLVLLHLPRHLAKHCR